MPIRCANSWLVPFLFSIACLVGCEETTTVEPPPKGLDISFDPGYPTVDAFPAWSPDGLTIAYFHYGLMGMDTIGGIYYICPDSMGIWFVNPDGSNPRLFIRMLMCGASKPAWSPDGTKIAFVGPDDQIYVIGSDETGLTRLTDAGTNLYPGWSPDGRQICYESDANAECDGIWTMSADGSNKRQLGIRGEMPDWSPDGGRIVFSRGKEIWRFDITEGIQEQINQLSDACFHPKHSPDGARILFWHPSQLRLDYVAISSIKPDGTDYQRIGDVWGGHPCWSPDGSKIAFIFFEPRYSSRRSTLWIMNADGSEAHQITRSPMP